MVSMSMDGRGFVAQGGEEKEETEDGMGEVTSRNLRGVGGYLKKEEFFARNRRYKWYSKWSSRT